MDPLGGGWTLDFLRSPTDPRGGGFGPWTFQKVQPTLWEGGGAWTFKKSESCAREVVQSDVRTELHMSGRLCIVDVRYYALRGSRRDDIGEGTFSLTNICLRTRYVYERSMLDPGHCLDTLRRTLTIRVLYGSGGVASMSRAEPPAARLAGEERARLLLPAAGRGAAHGHHAVRRLDARAAARAAELVGARVRVG